MRPVQLRRPRRGSDFVLPDVPMLESPEWSDEDVIPHLGRICPATRHPAHHHHRHRKGHAGAMAMHPGHGHHMGSPGMMMPLAPAAQYGSPFRAHHIAAPVGGFNYPGCTEATHGAYAPPKQQFGGRSRQTANAAPRTGNTAHLRGHGDFQQSGAEGGGDDGGYDDKAYADDEYDAGSPRTGAAHGDGLTAVLDRVAEEETSAGGGGGDRMLASHYGGSFGVGRLQSRFQFKQGSLFAPSAHQFMHGVEDERDATESEGDGSDDVSVSTSTSGSDCSDVPSCGLPPHRRASMAQYSHAPTMTGAWLGEEAGAAASPPRRLQQHPSVFMANTAGRAGAAGVGAASAAPSIFHNFFDDDEENSFAGAAGAGSPSVSRSRTNGATAPSMMVSSSPHNGANAHAGATAAAGRPVHGNAVPVTAAAARLPDPSVLGNYSYTHSTTAPTNPAASNTAPATNIDSTSADPTNPTIDASPKLGGAFSNRRQGSFLMAMDEVPADARAPHAATTDPLPPDAHARGRRDGPPRPTQPPSPPQLSHGLQAERWTSAKRGGLTAALAQYTQLTKRSAGQSRAASATSTRSAHSDRPGEGPPPPHPHPRSDDAPDSDEDSAVLERRSRFFEPSTSRRHVTGDEEGGQQPSSHVYANTRFTRGMSGRISGQQKIQSPAALPVIKGQPDRINFRHRIASRGQSAGGGGGGGGVAGSGGSANVAVGGAPGLPPRRPASATVTDSTAFSVELLHGGAGAVTAMSSAASTPHDAVVTASATEADEYGLLAWPAGSPMRTRVGSTVSFGGFSDLAGGISPAGSPSLKPDEHTAARGAGVVPLSLQPLSSAAASGVAGGGWYSRRTSSNASPHTVVTILDEAGGGALVAPGSTRRISPSSAALARSRGASYRTPLPPQLTASTLQSADVAAASSVTSAAAAARTARVATMSAVPTTTAAENSVTTAPSPMTPSPRPPHRLSLYHQDEYFRINSFRGNGGGGSGSDAASPYGVSTASATASAARRSRDDELDPLAQPRQSLCALLPNRLGVAEDDQRRLSRSNLTPGASPAPQRAPSSVRVAALSPFVFASTAGAAGPHDVPFASTPQAGRGDVILALDGEYQFFTRDTEVSSAGVGEGAATLAENPTIVSTHCVAVGQSTVKANASPRSAAPSEVERPATPRASASGNRVASIVSAEEVQLPHKPRKGAAAHEKRRSSPRERSLPPRPTTSLKTQPTVQPWDSCPRLPPTTSAAGMSAPQQSVARDARSTDQVAVASATARERSSHAPSHSSRRLKVFAKRMTM